ncbi:MAG: hypothetical protein OEM62_00960 [Acidobacteriota bacterium]|nr:hypothetical protein [Acidobacteriota bacterium]
MTTDSVPQQIPSLADLKIERLGGQRVPSPFQKRRKQFVDEKNRVLVCSTTDDL